MVELREVVEFLNKELVLDKIPDKCQNGLQVQGRKGVTKIAFAVDVTLKVIQKAVKNECDMIISHHALIWTAPKIITGLLSSKLKLLMKQDISLYVAHHPMDIHKKYSHGRLIADELGLYGIDKFGKSGEHYFGFSGNIRKKVSLQDLKKIVDIKLKTDSRIFSYGKKEISSICIISGGGGFAVEQAVIRDIDCYITGEMKHGDLLAAKDRNLNVLLAGHYETETLGMIKLSHSITKKFKIPCVFIES